MAVRFRKSKKLGPGIRVNVSKSGLSTTIGPRGNSVSIGKKGVYHNAGIPGTGLSMRTKLSGGSSSNSGSLSATGPNALAGLSSSQVRIEYDADGTMRFFNGDAEVNDPSVIAAIKRTDQYKAMLPKLRDDHRAAVLEKIGEIERESASFTQIYKSSPNVVKRKFYEAKLARLAPETSSPKPYTVPEPSRQDVEEELARESEFAVSGMPWKVKKLRQKYVEDNLPARLQEEKARWCAEKDRFEASEEARSSKFNAEQLEAYNQAKASLEAALGGDVEYIEAACGDWIEGVELPVDIDTQFEYRAEDSLLMVDLDLPEIEDLPTETAVQLANGNMKMKEKTQKALRMEYAECVFGVTVYVAANLFNISPAIKKITISGYTQRRDKAGDVVDEYIVSVRFEREGFYCVDFKEIDPEEFCLRFENRCNVTSTKVFKAIEPFE